MPSINPRSLVQELMTAYAGCRTDVAPPSSRDSAFDLDSAYAVQAEFARLRRADGHKTVGWKTGYANKAVWRALKLDTLVWAHLYDDTVQYASNGQTSVSIAGKCAPKIEPEVVFKLKAPVATDDAAAAIAAAEWIAIGFEIIDCVYANWQFRPADFVAAFGLHSALIVGEPLYVHPRAVERLVEELAQFRVQLRKNGRLIEEGSGKNALKSPALCVAELTAAMSRRNGSEPLQARDLISTGTLTASQLISAGETWTVDIEGIGLLPLTLAVRP